MKVQKAQSALPGEQNFQAAAERIGGDENQDRRERRAGLSAEDLFDERVFEVRMEGAEDDFHKFIRE